jgi:hypothetical protein
LHSVSQPSMPYAYLECQRFAQDGELFKQPLKLLEDDPVSFCDGKICENAISFPATIFVG